MGGFDMATSNAPMRSSRSSSASSSSSKPRQARFAEATSVNSPVDPADHRSPFADPPSASSQNAKPSDVGFGYISSDPVEQHATVPNNQVNGPGTAPLKSALKVPGTPGRHLNPMSPTFREEQLLEKQEEETEIEQAKDLVSHVYLLVDHY